MEKMKKINCPNCGKEHSAKRSGFCSGCGTYINLGEPHFSIGFIIYAIVAVFILGLAFIYAQIETGERPMIFAFLFGICAFVGVPFCDVWNKYSEKLKKYKGNSDDKEKKGKSTNSTELSNGVVVVLFIMAMFFFVELIGQSNTCSHSYCNNTCVKGSSYCSKHQPKTISYSSSKGKSISNTGSSTGKSVYNYSTGKSSHYNAYDEGYDAIADDDDYDWDRYWSDDDYARGVDDAIDDYDWD